MDALRSTRPLVRSSAERSSTLPGRITFAISPPVTPSAIADLREAVGWDRLDDDYPAALAGYWATVGGFDASGGLVAWCAIVGDGVRHAVLLDVIVHPDWQRQGIGRELVARAVDHCRAHTIAIIHVDFLPERATFYARCGFRVGLGGIYESLTSAPHSHPAHPTDRL